MATAHRAMDVPRGTRGILELHEGRVRATKRIRPADLARLAARALETPARRASPGAVKLPGRPARGADPRADAGRRAVEPLGGGAEPSGPLLVQLIQANLFVEYRAVLKNVNWRLHQGEQWAIYGANGAGKSSFLKLLYGDLSPALGGRIERKGFPPAPPSPIGSGR